MKKLWTLECTQNLYMVDGKCSQPVRIVINRHLKSKPVKTVDSNGKMKIVYMYPSEHAKDGLCYYHWKKKEGRLSYNPPFKGKRWVETDKINLIPLKS